VSCIIFTENLCGLNLIVTDRQTAEGTADAVVNTGSDYSCTKYSGLSKLQAEQTIQPGN